MKSGHHPHVAIPLEKIGLNTNIKRRFLQDLNMITQTENRPSKRLGDAIIRAHTDGQTYISQTKIMVRRNGSSMSDEYLGPIKFIVAIVGPQQQ